MKLSLFVNNIYAVACGPRDNTECNKGKLNLNKAREGWVASGYLAQGTLLL